MLSHVVAGSFVGATGFGTGPVIGLSGLSLGPVPAQPISAVSATGMIVMALLLAAVAVVEINRNLF